MLHLLQEKSSVITTRGYKHLHILYFNIYIYHMVFILKDTYEEIFTSVSDNNQI